ncbi:MAG: anti-sigma factor [Granulosicoccus sp.]|nr:anti-sigma factor [Granulosicoccus sp.]
MTQRDDREWDLLAGEFVLGTLSEREQKLYASIYRHDIDFQERVTAWRERFAPLDAAAGSVEPDASVWQAISRELRFSDTQALRNAATPHPHSNANEDNEISSELAGDMASVLASHLDKGLDDSLDHSLDRSLDRSLDSSLDHSLDSSLGSGRFSDNPAQSSGEFTDRLAENFDDTTGDFSSELRPFATTDEKPVGTFWRALAGIATAAALILSVLLVYSVTSNQQGNPPLAAGFLSVIVDAEEKPLWIVDGNSADSGLRLIALNPPVIAEDKAHELWLLSENNAVVSLGLLPVRAGETLQVPAEAVTEANPRFAVSLEPELGSPGESPSGPVLYHGNWYKIQSGS